MSDISTLQSSLQAGAKSKSMGLKLLVVCGLALAMTIPALFLGGLVDDRTTRASDVAKEISSHVGGRQTFLGPTLAVPYSVPSPFPNKARKQGIYLVFPADASAVVKTSTAERRRSLFKVPVFQADLQLDAAFDLAGVPAAAPEGAELDWPRAQILVGVSDARGAMAEATLTADGKTTALAPSDIAQDLSLQGDQSQHAPLMLFGANIGTWAKPDTKFKVTSALRFSGAQRIAVLAYGKTTRLSARGDWPSPGFDGGFLPVARTVSKNGFTADWSVPFMARGVRAEGSGNLISSLGDTALGISFIEVADPYQSVSRSLKYVLLFLGLLFLSYFVFEATTGKRVHPAQYLLVGIAQIVFYLLLLSLAERIGFDLAFSIAGVATVALLSANAAWIFASRMQGLRALGIFSLLYGLIYELLRLEDNALLVGAAASFAAVAVAMYLTRKIDWYSSLAPSNGPGRQTLPITPKDLA